MHKEVYAKAKQIAEEYRSGVGRPELAEKYHCALNTIKNILKRELGPKYAEIAAKRYKATLFAKGDTENEHQFHKGEIRGAAARAYVKIGTISLWCRPQNRKNRRAKIEKRARYFIKVDDKPRARQKNWKPLGVYNWEKANNRPIPEGYHLFYLDGNSLNDNIDNLRLVTRAQALELNQQTKRKAFYGPAWQRKHQRAMQRIGADRRRVNRIRKIIPVPSCVRPTQEDGWQDNRDDDDIDCPLDFE